MKGFQTKHTWQIYACTHFAHSLILFVNEVKGYTINDLIIRTFYNPGQLSCETWHHDSHTSCNSPRKKYFDWFESPLPLTGNKNEARTETYPDCCLTNGIIIVHLHNNKLSSLFMNAYLRRLPAARLRSV